MDKDYCGGTSRKGKPETLELALGMCIPFYILHKGTCSCVSHLILPNILASSADKPFAGGKMDKEGLINFIKVWLMNCSITHYQLYMSTQCDYEYIALRGIALFLLLYVMDWCEGITAYYSISKIQPETCSTISFYGLKLSIFHVMPCYLHIKEHRTHVSLQVHHNCKCFSPYLSLPCSNEKQISRGDKNIIH